MCCLTAWTGMGHVTTYGKAASRTATAFFTVAGHTPEQVATQLAARRVNVWHGDHYAWEVTGALGIRDSGSAVRALPCTTALGLLRPCGKITHRSSGC